MYRLTGLGLNCPGDPGCYGYIPPKESFPVPSMDCTCMNGTCLESGNSCGSPDAGPVGSPAYIAQQNALVAAALKQQAAAGTFSFTNWLNAHSDMMLIGGAGLVGLLFLSSPGGLLGGRR
jgi:hypothetical protein